MNIYIINNLIHFDSEAFTLYRADAPEEALRIGAIASRCLTLLLQANGQIVSKRDLMNGAWGSFGLEVTENSLAQVVRQLRVALEKLQSDHELITTVPRIGYKINEQVELLDNSAVPASLAPPPPQTIEPSIVAAPVQPAEPLCNWPARMFLGLAALACWAALFQLPSLLRPVPLADQPFAQSHVEQIDGITVHSEEMPASALQPGSQQLVTQARQLGQIIGITGPDLHIYRFADRYRSLDLLCEGVLMAPDSQCLGLQSDE